MLKFSLSQKTPFRREEVLRVFERSSGLPAVWVEGLVAREQLEGAGYEEMATARLTFDTGSTCTYITETVLRNQLPDSITLALDAEGLHHECKWRFDELILDGQSAKEPARITSISAEHRIRFAGMNGLLTLLFRRSFIERAQQEIDRFLQCVVLENSK